jgi:hypothetical protein
VEWRLDHSSEGGTSRAAVVGRLLMLLRQKWSGSVGAKQPQAGVLYRKLF